MKQRHIIQLLPDYIDNLLTDLQKRRVEIHLAECSSCTAELDDIQMLLKTIKSEPIIIPSKSVQKNFFEQLEAEKQSSSKIVSIGRSPFPKKNNWTNNFLKIAASVVVLFSVYFFGKQQQAQVSNSEIAQLTDESHTLKQTAVLSLMGNKSASKRIQGVNFIEEFTEPDEAIVSALTDRMLHDENTNVRRTAVEVLSRFTTSETVKSSFIKALKNEKDPGIQITIIHLLAKIQEKKAIAPMQFLLDQEDTQPFVKEELKSILPNII